MCIRQERSAPLKCKFLPHWLLTCVIAVGGGCSVFQAENAERNDSAYQVPIALEGSLQNPAWSPDGEALVFTRFRNGYNKGPADLVVFDLAGLKTRMLVSDESDNVNLPGSAWNRNTGQIIFSSSREPHDEIYLIAVDGTSDDAIQVTNRDELAAYEPSLSPDGLWVVFETHEVDVEGGGVITKYKIDGAEPYQALTDVRHDCRQPNWSPDGQHILYQMMDDVQWDIWIMDSDGTNQYQVTDGPGDKTDASFSPDGQFIVYSAQKPETESANLYVISISGGKPKQVTFSNGYDGAPSWSPDGKRLAFETSSGDPETLAGTTIWVISIEDLR